MPIPGLKTRKPTGAVPYPCILLEGEEKAGKTWAAALLSASDKVSATYWIDLGEGAADEYGAIPGANYEIIEHDGSYAAIAEAVRVVKAEAQRAQAAGEKPVVLVVDTGSALWESLREWVDTRARKTKANRAKLAEDPDAEVKAPTNFWNDARSRWNRVMNPLLTFPGIVVVTSQGREVMKMGKDGRPIEGEKTWRAAVQEGFPYAVNVWVRMFRDANPMVVGARSVHLGIVPGKDAEREIKDPKAQERLLEWLIFDALRCDPHKVTTRDLQELSMGELSEEEKVTQAEEDATPAAAAPQQRTSRQRPQQPRSTRTPQQWKEAIAAATSRDDVSKLHAEADALGQLTQGLLQAMKDRVAEINAKTQEQQPADVGELVAPVTEAIAAQADDDDAAVEALLAEAERRGMLVDELAFIAEVNGWTVPQLIHRHLPDGAEEVAIERLQEVTAKLRPLAWKKLRSLGRVGEATTYEQVKPEEFGPRSFLLGEQPAAGDEADKAA